MYNGGVNRFPLVFIIGEYMGVNYDCNVVCGIRLDREELKVILSPAVYEDQPRYDTRTGKVIKTEKVLVKQEKHIYKFGEFEDEDFYDLTNNIAVSKGLDMFYGQDHEYTVVGQELFEQKDCGKLSAPEGECSEGEISDIFKEIREAFPGNEELVLIHAVCNIG